MITLRADFYTYGTVYYEIPEYELLELIDMLLDSQINNLCEECIANLRSLRYDYINRIW